jgi:PAS domain S-box-containing protein
LCNTTGGNLSFDNLANGWVKDLGIDRKHFNMFFDKMIDGFAYHKIIVDSSGKPVDYVFLEINTVFEKLTGLKREKIIGKKVTQVLKGIENDPANWLGVYGKVALSGEPAEFENFSEGLGKWFKVSAYCPEKGYFVAIFEDITKRKEAEQALAQSEQRWATTLSSIGDAVIATNVKGEITFMNVIAEKLTGWTLNEASMKPINEVFHVVNEKTRLEVENPIVRVLNEGVIVGLANHTVLLRKNGNEVPIDDSGAPIKDKDGNIKGVVLIFRDITERKKAEDSLKTLNDELEERVRQRTAQVSAERQRLYNVLETLPSYVILLDKDYRVKFANKVFRETFGEDHGRRCHEYLFGKDQECEGCITYNVIRENKPQHWYWTGPNGHDYDIYDFPFKEADGSALILEMGIDITERKKAEAQALESAKKLKDAERLAAIGATAGMVGHDIRNPLQAIASDVYLAKSDLSSMPEGEAKEGLKESLDGIDKNVEYINKIVQDLQDYARPINPKIEDSDLSQITQSILAKNGLPENIKTKVDISEDARIIKVDTYYLNRILSNLVTNAIQAMPQGGKLTIGSRKEAGDLVITVEDTGVGIPKSINDKMFTLMFTTKSKGQGFGLPVVKRMTESLGGTVTFESEEGKGTTFTIRLPPPRAKR